MRGIAARLVVAAASTIAVLTSGTSRALDEPPPVGPQSGISVRTAKKEQASLLASKEHCSADPDHLRALGRAVGHQVRVYRGGAECALFTVSEGSEEEPESVVRMGKAARERLAIDADSPARIVAAVPHPTLTDDQAKAAGEFVERLDDDGRAAGLLILAPHGGDIEPSTDLQALRLAGDLAGKPVAAWRCMGYRAKGGASASSRWHITATDTSEASFPRLAEVAKRRFAFAVSFHGMAREGVLIGGGASRDLKEEVRSEVARALEGTGIPVTIAEPGDSLGGSNPRNIVNRYCPGTGIQVEQSGKARREHWRAIADAVARVYARRL